MKNASSLKCTSNDSPKTPGGISKSLLTPCRRIGLSRNWKKGGPSPFISPLSSGEVKDEKVETRKRKDRTASAGCETTPDGADKSLNVANLHSMVSKDGDIDRTPSRNIDVPRRKRTKTLLSAITNSQSESDVQSQSKTGVLNEENPCNDITQDSNTVSVISEHLTISNINKGEINKDVQTPVYLKSKSRSKQYVSPPKPYDKDEVGNNEVKKDNSSVYSETGKLKHENIVTKAKSPNELTKECIVVIQKKLFKKSIVNTETVEKQVENPVVSVNTHKDQKPASQTLFDSDNDDVPLNQLTKKQSKIIIEKPIDLTSDDDDFTTNKNKIRKIHANKAQTTKMKPKNLTNNVNTKNIILPILEKPLQSDDDDDDFDFDNKRTILMRKTYEKVTKPLKAKSTGSITQKDIDDLKARIESKKKLLLAKAMTDDTKELRELIKKWQKGCQNALIELMDLMKNKMPDNKNMDYSEILQTLKIPAALVGYDAENDSFNTPDDAKIILANVNVNDI